jgi:L-asparagine transporter-like permease
LWAWMAILLSHISFRKSLSTEQLAASKYKMPLSPYSNYLTLIFVISVYIIMIINPASRIPALLTPLWFAFLVIIYWLTCKPVSDRRR